MIEIKCDKLGKCKVIAEIENLDPIQAANVFTILFDLINQYQTPEQHQQEFIRKTAIDHFNNKLMAVKIIKEKFGFDLKSAKDIIEAEYIIIEQLKLNK